MSKKIFTILLAGMGLLTSANSCSAKEKNPENKDKTMQEMKTDGKKLVVFFSHTGENYNVGYIEKGNTAIIADMIAEATGADKFEIEPVNPYPKESYEKCIEIAKKEKNSNARPAIKHQKDISDYDVIFIGYPNWWGEVPMCVYTFIESQDWNGKTVIPFITHEGSGMSGTDKKIASACKGSTTLTGKGLAVQGKLAQEQQATARKNVNRWLDGLGIK